MRRSFFTIVAIAALSFAVTGCDSTSSPPPEPAPSTPAEMEAKKKEWEQKSGYDQMKKMAPPGKMPGGGPPGGK